MLEALISFSLATIVLAFSPGPDNIYVLTQSISNGSKAGIATVAGLISGCIVHTALLAFGVSALITASPQLFFIIKLIGAAYLLYLAFKIYKSDASIAIDGTQEKKSYIELFKIGVVMNLLNPKVMLFFLAFFPAFIWNPDGNTTLQFFILGGTFMLVSFLVFSSIAILAGKISKYLRQSNTIGVVLKWLQIIVFVGIAIFIFI
ncbi:MULTISPECIES: LysE family translocator [Croceibacter]|jgi:threonine/homoserine/homoserine lactone efflux protein|uniref:Lysine transporter LysE n=1 Tax=Croceibacter atlanticus (strain ATCC BAA-628 / JCM 21780 / CIP 108009 / IAM 15332 / KCTC 12090 / HTCC2559) TaxID=216432 RepID=A3UBP8_CROAH|nr:MULTISPECIES: LysE family translocator [Croceibacter]EAP86049.1 hypothetical protein CA2559_08451 [Croceibacter atlanticus HTCC2559]MBG26384.1 LysE family translocator [Croceibacter sp.]MBW4969105.1 LysE family translocator [Croceibacter atlanticus]|tara:strand:+ start:359 stop:970 length:612 start_codon:yes stop_codon:yes gene_type:complete